jgi:hypothetical protein
MDDQSLIAHWKELADLRLAICEIMNSETFPIRGQAKRLYDEANAEMTKVKQSIFEAQVALDCCLTGDQNFCNVEDDYQRSVSEAKNGIDMMRTCKARAKRQGE